MDLNECRRRIPKAIESREFQYCVWNSGKRQTLGVLHVLEPGVVIIDVAPSIWTGVLCPPRSKRAVLSANSLMPSHISGSFDIFDTSEYSIGTLGGNVRERGFAFWVDLEWNRDAHLDMMMTKREWESLSDWLRGCGLVL